MKKTFMLLFSLLMLTVSMFAGGEGKLIPKAKILKTRADLVQMFPNKEYRESHDGGYTFFKPRARVGEKIELCSGVVAKVITAPNNGKVGLVWSDRIFVKFKDQSTRTHGSANTFLKGMGSEIMSSLEKTDKIAFVAKVPQGQNLEAFIKALNNRPEIEYAEMRPIYYTYYTPTDPGYPNQWHWTLLKMEDAWNITRGSSSVILEVNDSGVSLYTNSDAVNTSNINGTYVKSRELQNVNIYNDGGFTIDPYNSDSDAEDDFGHGTFIANLIFGDMNDGQDGAGMAPNCTVMPFKSGGCSGTIAYGTNGINYGSGTAKAINCSYGGPSYSSTDNTACNNAWDNGSIVVVASGNDGANSMGYPAGYINSVAVGATTSSGAWWSSSNWDEGSTAGYQHEANEIFCVTPSANMYGTGMEFSHYNGSGYDCGTADPSNQNWSSGNYGTSYSCPQLVGMIGLMASAGTVDPQTILNIIANTADHTSNGNSPSTATSSISGANTYDWKYGHGLPDVGAALAQCVPSPYIVYDSKSIDDSTGGDNDSIAEAGETIDLFVTLKNTGTDVLSSVSTTLSSDDYWVSIANATIGYSNIAIAGTQTNATGFSVEINSHTPDVHDVEFSMVITGTFNGGANNYEITRTFRMTVGFFPVLIIDVDGGAQTGDWAYESQASIEDALAKNNWSFKTLKALPADVDSRFDMIFVADGGVFIATSVGSEDLTSAEVDSLTSYVTDGGNVYVESSGAEDYNWEPTSMWAKFGISYGSEGTTWDDATSNIYNVTGQGGTSGSGLGSSILYDNNENMGGYYGVFCNAYNKPLTPQSSGTAIAVKSNGGQGNNLNRVIDRNIASEGKTIYSDILLGAIDSANQPSNERYNYMNSICNFFMGTGSVTDVTAPAKTILSASLDSYNEGVVNLSWTTPGDDGWSGRNWYAAGGYAYYDLEYKASSSGTWLNAAGEPTPCQTPETSSSFQLTGLTAGQSYDFRLRTQDEAGNYSDYSDVISIDVLAAPASWGAATSYPGKAILVWIEGSADSFGESAETATAFEGRISNFGYSYSEVTTAGDIGNLSSYDMVIYCGGICNYGGNQESYFASMDLNRQQNFMDTGGFLYTELQWADSLFSNTAYCTTYLGASNGDYYDNYGLGGGNSLWTYPMTGQSGTYAVSDSLSNAYDSNWEIAASMLQSGSGVMAYRSANGYYVSSDMPHGVFSTILANNISNTTEQADYIDRILGKFGCTNFSDTYPPAPMTLNASPGALSGSARLTWNA
ncbi:S8 family serine peptidase, partial [bacterium]|nr:S8 family serine peptidase [bacterium]